MSYEIIERQLGSTRIYLLEYKDEFDPLKYLESLTAIELERYFQFNNIKRQKEFVATRILCHSVFGYQEIKYEAHGAPYIDNHDYISISHAQQLVGIACNEKHPVGFDIELIHDKILGLYHKFLNKKEIEQFDVSNTKELISCWSMKETLYKLAGRKEILFKEQLLLDRKEPLLIKGTILNPTDEIVVDLQVMQYKNFIISTNTSELHVVERKFTS